MFRFASGQITVGDHPHSIVTHFGYPIVPTQPNSALIIVLDVVLIVAAVAIIANLVVLASSHIEPAESVSPIGAERSRSCLVLATTNATTTPANTREA